MHKPHRKPWPKSKTSDIYKQMKVKNDHRSKFSKRRSLKKNQGFNGIRTRDLRVTGALLYQLSYEATHWERGQLIEFVSPNCLNWKIYCDDHSSLSSTTAVQNELFHIYFTSFLSRVPVHCITPFARTRSFHRPTFIRPGFGSHFYRRHKPVISIFRIFLRKVITSSF